MERLRKTENITKNKARPYRGQMLLKGHMGNTIKGDFCLRGPIIQQEAT
jgi:hypothetical protein